MEILLNSIKTFHSTRINHPQRSQHGGLGSDFSREVLNSSSQSQQTKPTEWKKNIINKAAGMNLLLISFVIYTIGDLLGLFMNTFENQKRNPKEAFSLFCQNLAFIVCNLVIYWGAVFGVKKLTNHFSHKFVEGFEPKDIASKAADRISDVLGLLAGLPFNDLIKPIGVSMLTNYFINNPPQQLVNFFGFNQADSMFANAGGGLTLKQHKLIKQ